jgi:excinuclease ABC A subunit
MGKISLKKVGVHNLKGVDLELEPDQLIVFTGVSGSGKSSMAFDTLYVEGQRRYVESLSNFARRYVGDMAKPEAEAIEGLSPTISIEQKTAGRNPRSTVGTITEIYDYLRVLYARVAVPHCPVSGEAVEPQSRERIIRTVQGFEAGQRIVVMAPFVKGKKGTLKDELDELERRGFLRARVDGQMVDLSEGVKLDGSVAHSVDVVIDRIKVGDNGSRIAEAITMALEVGQGVCLVDDQLFSQHAFSPKSGLSYAPLEPQHFSFNSPHGMCPKCQGMGLMEEFDLDEIIDPDLSIADDCCLIAPSYDNVKDGNIYRNLAKLYKFSVRTKWKKLSREAQNVFLHGIGDRPVKMRFVHPERGTRWSDYVRWKGVLWEAHRRYSEATSETYRNNMREWMVQGPCTACAGSRLAPYPAAAKLGGVTIAALCGKTVGEAAEFFGQVGVDPIADELLKEIRQRLQFLLDVGLHYLTIDRTAPTLSGGEAQRVRLASQIGCGLVGVTYILDEPSIGLHPRDNRQLIRTLEHLRDRGNTVIVVEHDEETIWAADHVVDFGPLAGVHGGEIVCQGTVSDLLKSERSVTGAYLSGRKSIPVPEKRRPPTDDAVVIEGACHNNLKNITARFPKGLFLAVTGVSGSGKSSLVLETLYPALKERDEPVIAIDQRPIGRTPRSNPATYTKVWDLIRDLFAQLPESKARGYKPGRFSFNVATGSCSECRGMGMTKVDMDFIEDAYVPCELCGGHRFDEETLTVRFKEKNIYDVLEMPITEALEFFENVPRIAKKLEALVQVGMGYVKLGQSSTTLSGGEAQRVKLAKELSRPSSGNTFYLLDEPTTGLHFHDVDHLLRVLQQLVDKGNTVLVIEHNMDVVRCADWIIDVGPDGGAGGGEIVAEGTPEEIAKLDSPTGRALRPITKTARKAARRKRPVRAITVDGCEQNNLKGVDAWIPRGKITVCTGPSGSGKSSFAFETVYAEGQRRYTESLSPYARQFVQQMPKPVVTSIEGLSPAIAIEQRAHAGNPRSTVGTLTEVYDFLRILFARAGVAHCPDTGEVICAISKEHVADRVLAYEEGARIEVLAPLPKEPQFDRLRRQGFLRVRLNGETYELDGKIPYNRRRKNHLYLVIDRLKVNGGNRQRLLEAIENAGDQVVILHDCEEHLFNLTFAVESTGISYPAITPRTLAFNKREGMCETCEGWGNDCPECEGERLNPLGRNVRLGGLSLGQLCLQPVSETITFLDGLKLDKTNAKLLDEVLEQLSHRLRFLAEVGLDYLALHRGAPTLSAGEMQRIRLARQLGSGLTGCLYVLDEPTIGLHPHDNARLNTALERLRDLGNTILMVEHDPLTVERADYLLDFGPGAGAAGGHITARGTINQIKKDKNSLTGAYLSGRKSILVPTKRRTSDRYLKIEGASSNNLKNIDVQFPIGCLSVVTGVSGSGKSSLLQEIENLDPFDTLIVLDQNPIGQTIRADVGSYADIMPPIRQLFARLPTAITRGLKPGHFSYNHRSGMCTNCWGLGHRRIEMHFLPAVRVPCEECCGQRLNPVSLEITYAGHTIGQLLDLTVDQAHTLFKNHRAIVRRLSTLQSVGLGYLKLGQRVQTLSGGEAQRLKLSRELAKRSTGNTLYLLDEPTTGLHPDDLAKLLPVLHTLTDRGNTLIIIEHNLDLIASADYIVDLGPGPGQAGGHLLASGTPEQIALTSSPTAQFLKGMHQLTEV